MMKRTIFFIFGIIFFCGSSIMAFAGEVSTITLANKPIFQTLGRMTVSTIKEIRDIGSIYEVVTESRNNPQPKIFYVTKDEQYIIAGSVYDQGNRNITQSRMQEVDKVVFSKLPLQDAIVTKKGTGAKTLVSISDVDCPYCRRAHDWLETQDNYTLYTFLFPLDQIHPQSHAKSVSILCAQNENSAMHAAFRGMDLGSYAKKDIPQDQCEKRLAKHSLTAQIANATGTPTFIKPDGMKISGFDQKALEDYLHGGNNRISDNSSR